MKVTLKNLADGIEKEFLPQHFPLVIGRGDGTSLQIDDRWASRRHCQLDLLEGRLVVRDLDSKHGTLVNGSPVNESKLHADDVLSVGLTALSIVIEAPEEAENLEPSPSQG